MYLLQLSRFYPSVFNGKAIVPKSLDNEMLWHKKLENVSEKGLSEFSKHDALGNEPLSNLKFCKHCVLVIKLGLSSLKVSILPHMHLNITEFYCSLNIS